MSPSFVTVGCQKSLLIVASFRRPKDRVTEGGFVAGNAAGGRPVEECAVRAIGHTHRAREGAGAVLAGALRPAIVWRLRGIVAVLDGAHDWVTKSGIVAGNIAGSGSIIIRTVGSVAHRHRAAERAGPILARTIRPACAATAAGGAEGDGVAGAGGAGLQGAAAVLVVSVGILARAVGVDVIDVGLGGSGPIRDDTGGRRAVSAAAAILVRVVFGARAQADTSAA